MGQTVRDRQLAVLARCDAANRARETEQRIVSASSYESTHDRPMAAKGLISYRCRGIFGWIMIGAHDHEDAFREALRSSGAAKRETLEIWDGTRYVPA